MQRNEVDRNKVAPMMRHYLELKDNYEDTLLFYRLGDFYEMFFDDAITASHELELTLTGRNCGLDERVPMCGVPHHAVDSYIDKLIKKGFKVAICEQLEDPKQAKGIVKRDVVEVISSGTITSSNSLNEKENNFIGYLGFYSYLYILCYADITTGEVYLKLIDNDINKVINQIVFLSLKEVIVPTNIDRTITSILNKEYHITISTDDNIIDNDNYQSIYKNITDQRYIDALKHLLYYLVVIQKRTVNHFQEMTIINSNDYMKMDVHTKRNLELTESMRNHERMYSLLWLLDNTKTAMGSRRLKSFIESPLVDKKEIEKRYDIVSKLLEEFILCEDLRSYLYEVYDLERLCGKISLGSANARDLLQLKNSLKVFPELNEIFKKLNYHEIDDVSSLYELLETSINEDAPITLKEGYLIKDGYNKELDELKDLRSGGKDFISKFEEEERERTGIKNLKVGFNKVFGYYIEVSKGNIKDVKEEYGYIRKQTLANCERYVNAILKEKEDLVLSSEEKIINMEYDLFIEIRDKVKDYIDTLQRIAKIISEIDVLQSFAQVSDKYNYIRPTINSDNTINIIESRHPVVEKVIKDNYVANDIVMDSKTNIILITGPNMAGKSTYMRQLGIIAIMAQIGCFVPAKEASLPIFDQIFTRIGASDDLVSGESTFMVEMMEASNAIKNATPNSLILFDELGRGTATFDGMSLAQAILEYINNNIGCKTLFSTHYHELTSLDKTLKGLKNKHVSAKEDEDGNTITFLHKVIDGSVDKSYGINVAKLAGLPETVISRASEILKVYENKENKRDKYVQESLPLDFNINKPSEVEKLIKEKNILEMTPIEAINFLYELKNKIK